MIAPLRRRVSAAAGALAQAFGNADLRRLQLAGAGSVIGTWSYGVALAVYAYDAGGAAAVGLVAVIRYVPSAIASPLTAVLADRHPRVRVMVAADVLRMAAMAAAAAVVVLEASPAIVYALAVVTSVAATAFRPAQSALLPSLARTPDELTASNVAASTIESVGVFIGPALGGLLLAATGAEVVFALNGVTFLWSAALIVRIRGEERRSLPRASVGKRRGLIADGLAGFALIARQPSLRVIVLLTSAQTLVFGALTVLIVVLAFDVLETGSAGVGFLNSAIGVGGLLGSVAAAALIGRPWLGTGFGLGVALWGLPLALVALWANPFAALVGFAFIGIANTVVDVSGLTLMQRVVPDAVLARVFGALEGLIVATIGLGALIAPALVSLLGARGALLATGAALPIVTALSWRTLSRIDAVAPVPGTELDLLRAIPMFAALPVPTLEQLASKLARIDVSAGREVVRQAEPGDRFYVVAEGELEVAVDGEASGVLRAGDHFGEIALLRDVARTATVRAGTDALLYALEREDFIAAVTGHPPSADAADAVIAARLGTLRASTA